MLGLLTQHQHLTSLMLLQLNVQISNIHFSNISLVESKFRGGYFNRNVMFNEWDVLKVILKKLSVS